MGFFSRLKKKLRKAWRKIRNIVKDLWDATVGRVLEEVANLLGFEDQTIVTAYVVTNPLNGDQPYLSPWKQAFLNRLKYGTDIIDEIKNAFISGTQVRIRYITSRMEKAALDPSGDLIVNYPNCAAAKTIIEAELGGLVTITIQTCAINLPDNESYGLSFIITDPLGLGLNYQHKSKIFFYSGQAYMLRGDAPITLTEGAEFYNVDVYYNINTGIRPQTALTNGITVTPSYNVGPLDITLVYQVETALNTLLSLAPTYLYYATVSLQTVRVDTVTESAAGTDSSTPGFYADGSQTVTVDTVYEATTPTVNPAESAMTYEETTLTNFIPWAPDSSRQYEITYTRSDDPDPTNPVVYYWFYILDEENDVTHPELYESGVEYTNTDDTRFLPIFPIKENNVWISDRTDDDAIYYLRTLDAYGIDGKQLADDFKADPNGNETEIRDIYLLWGVNLATVASQASLRYLADFFEENMKTPTGVIATDYAQLRDDMDIVQAYIDNRSYSSYDENDPQYYYLNPPNFTERDDTHFKDLLVQYVSDDWTTYWTEYQASLVYVENLGVDVDPGFQWSRCWQGGIYSLGTCRNDPTYVFAAMAPTLLSVMEKDRKAMTVSLTVKAGNYNAAFNYGPATFDVLAGLITPGAVEGDVLKEITGTGARATFTLKRQLAGNTYRVITIRDMVGHYLIPDATGTKVYYAPLDFVGDDRGGSNIANNFCLPMTLGFLANASILQRKQILYENTRLQMLGLNVVTLRYYETAGFLSFFGFVMKVIAIVFIFIGNPKIADFLWALAKTYGTKLIIERVIQEIILANPDSKLAQAVAVTIAVAIGVYGGDITEPLEQMVLGVDATTQVKATLLEYESEITQDLLTKSEDKLAEIKETVDTLQVNSALLDYVKEQITMRVYSPDTFFQRHLDADTVNQALDLDSLIDVEQLLNLDKTLDITFERDL